MTDIAAQMKVQLSEMGVEVQLRQIEVELFKWIGKFKIHPDEARKYVFNFFLKENNTKYPENWNLLRKIIYKKANYKCQYCGKRGFGLNAHHLNHNKGSNDLDNLICVCDECHSIIHPKNRKLSNKHYNNLSANFGHLL